jgi:hypothetical protein
LAEDLHEISVGIVEGVEGDVWFEDAELYPGALLLHMERWAAQQYAGALVLLTMPAVATASLVLLRGLLEAYAHLSWIAEGSDDGPTSRRCRALCYERTAAKELLDAVSNAAAGVAADGADEEAQRRVDNLDRLLRGLKCRCRGRDFSSVLPTIRQIAAADPAARWMPDMVRATRMTAHQAQRDRLHAFGPDGALVIGSAATPYERLVLLEWLVVGYARLSRELARILRPMAEVTVAAKVAEVKAGIVTLMRVVRPDLVEQHGSRYPRPVGRA